jgi:hypothetical protein
MALGCGKGSKEIAMLDSGNLVKHKVMEYMYGLMVIDMKEVSKIA